MKISWKNGFHSRGAAAENCYQELEVIRRREGDIKPESIVKQAKKKASRMHDLFEWEDSKAASEFRLEQARSIVRCIEVVYAEAPNVKARVYHITTKPAVGKEKPRKVYQSTEELLKDPITRDELLSRAILEALSYRKRYACLSELVNVFSAMDDFVRSGEKILQAK